MSESSLIPDKWLSDLKKNSKNGIISNRDIMHLVEKKDLGEDELSALYEALHDDNYEISFDIDVSDEELELIESEIAESESETEASPDMDASLTIDDPVKMYLKEIGALKLLDSEEEIALAKAVQKGMRHDATEIERAQAKAAKQ